MIVFRYFKYLFLIVVGLALVVLAIANNAPVTLQLLPQDTALWMGVEYAIELPLFLVILGGVVTGLLVGFVWEWLREHRHRAAAVHNQREARRFEQEVVALKGTPTDESDEILALVDDTRTAR